MVSKCANPACSADFRYFRSGKLFEFEVGEQGSTANPAVAGRKTSRRVEYFWLCADCALQMTLLASRDGEVVFAPVAKPPQKAAAAL